MPLGDFVQPGTLPKPLSIGRAGRLISGVGSLFFVAWLIIHRDALVGSDIPHLGWWVGIFIAFYSTCPISLWWGSRVPGVDGLRRPVC